MNTEIQTSVHITILQRIAEAVFVYYNNAFRREAANALPTVEVGDATVTFHHRSVDRRLSYVVAEVKVSDRLWNVVQEYSYGVPGGIDFQLVGDTVSDDIISDMEEVNSLFTEAVAYCSSNFDQYGKPITVKTKV